MVQVNADFRGLNIWCKILFNNKLENRLLKNTHKKQEDERLYCEWPRNELDMDFTG